MIVGALCPPAWFDADALVVAERALGCLLVRGEVVARITEVEAYRWPGDTANHCRMGRTRRNAPMWGPPGHAYVYVCYGIHPMLNLVCDAEGAGAAVLVRGVEVVAGGDEVVARRGPVRAGWMSGPGKVGAGLGLGPEWSGHPLFEPGGLELRVGPPPASIVRGPRVGIGYASPEDRAAPWRLADGMARVVPRIVAPGAP